MISSLGSGQGLATQWRQALFQKTDSNSDSKVSKDELIASLQQSPFAESGQDLTAIADKIMGGQDKDGDGSLTQDEFLSGPPRFDSRSNAVLLQAQEQSGGDPLFARVDADSDGKLTSSELTDALGGSSASDATTLAQQVIDALDSDGDGAVSTDEFATARKAQAAEGAKAAFTAADSDGDGQLSETEFASALQQGPGGAGGPPPGGPPPGGPPPGGVAPAGGSGTSSSASDDTDSDGDGIPDSQEATSATATGTTTGTGSTGTGFSVSDLMAQLDSNADNSLSLDEFAAALQKAGEGQQHHRAGFGSRLSSGTLGFMVQSQESDTTTAQAA
jgi:Ca2+-binding EF-hand superfamily protein